MYAYIHSACLAKSLYELRTFFDEANTMILPHDSGWGSSHCCKSEVMRKPIVIGLLSFPEEEARVEYRMVGLRF